MPTITKTKPKTKTKKIKTPTEATKVTKATVPPITMTDTGTLKIKDIKEARKAAQPIQALPSTIAPPKKPKDATKTLKYKRDLWRQNCRKNRLNKHMQKAVKRGVPILDFILLYVIENFTSEEVEELTNQLQALIDYNKNILPPQIRAARQGAFLDAYPRYSDNLEGRIALVAEDNPFNRKLLVTLLENQGIVCCEAKDGEEALNLYQAIPDGAISFIFMDIRMPGIDGLEATRLIRTSGRKDSISVPIIGVSTSEFPDDIKAAREAGVTQYTTKPINIDVLVAIMKDIARR